MEKSCVAVVEVFESELRDRLCRENDGDFIFSDLTGLYVDIISEISKVNKAESVIIYDYAKLLEQELQLYTAVDAYKAGQVAKDKPLDVVANEFMIKVNGVKNSQQIDNRIQAYFVRITELLGDKSGLITEFTEAYNQVHGMVKNNIHEFIRLGQCSVLA